MPLFGLFSRHPLKHLDTAPGNGTRGILTVRRLAGTRGLLVAGKPTFMRRAACWAPISPSQPSVMRLSAPGGPFRSPVMAGPSSNVLLRHSEMGGPTLGGAFRPPVMVIPAPESAFRGSVTCPSGFKGALRRSEIRFSVARGSFRPALRLWAVRSGGFPFHPPNPALT
jgi:hypothetical protein